MRTFATRDGMPVGQIGRILALAWRLLDLMRRWDQRSDRLRCSSAQTSSGTCISADHCGLAGSGAPASRPPACGWHGRCRRARCLPLLGLARGLQAVRAGKHQRSTLVAEHLAQDLPIGVQHAHLDVVE
jgi:hypothetical protein